MRSPVALFALVAACLTGCPEADVMPCGSDVCPSQMTCVAAMSLCVNPEDVVACNGMADGADCHTGAIVGKCLSGACFAVTCGDGIVQPGEVCDDGNRVSGDGCSYDCLSTETCGNGYVDFVKGEQCDDGNTAGSDGCEANCQLPRCGDGIVNIFAGEVCDDGNNEDGDGCSRDCKSTEKCGNGVRDPGEECDGSDVGSAGSNAVCQPNCRIKRCGDGIVDADTGEQCDDGNFDNTDACLNTCKTATCGDGFIRGGSGSNREECDDGNRENGDNCTNACKLARCGDGITFGSANGGTEQCDDGNSDDHDCCLTGCRLPICGDGIISCSERCDDGGSNNGPGKACRDSCSTVCPSTPLGIDFGQDSIVSSPADPNSGSTEIDFGIYGGIAYGAIVIHQAFVLDLSDGEQIFLEPENLTDVSTTSDLVGSPSGFNNGVTDSGAYCSTRAEGIGAWTPAVDVTVTDACGVTYNRTFTGDGIEASGWPTCN